MSFSFVSSRGDYFSFHSFVSCDSSLSPPALLSPPPVRPELALYLTLRISRAVPFSPRIPRTLLIRLAALSFAHAAPTPSRFGASRHKVIILRDAREKLRTKR